MSPLGIAYHQTEGGCMLLHGPLLLVTVRSATLQVHVLQQISWNITVYDTDLVDIKALYDLPERYGPRLANINFTAAACTVSH